MCSVPSPLFRSSSATNVYTVDTGHVDLALNRKDLVSCLNKTRAPVPISRMSEGYRGKNFPLVLDEHLLQLESERHTHDELLR